MALGPGSVAAFTPGFVDPAEVTAATAPTLARHALPLGPWANGTLPTRPIEGQVSQTAWRLDGLSKTTLDLLLPLRAQLQQAGFQTLFECDTATCGGYDFRFQIAVLPEPAMHVDLGDFQFLAAENTAGTVASLLVSRSASAGHVQLTLVQPAPGATLSVTPAPGATILTLPPGGVPQSVSNPTGVPASGPQLASPQLAIPQSPVPLPIPAPQDPAAPATPIAESLASGGVAVLEGLTFASGADDLSPGDYPVLADLAAWLRANPERQVALVGHTDASGALAGNISLSRRRAAAVRARLIAELDVPAAQLDAQGVGYLAPRASNLTEDGRTKNRRVEAIVTSTR